ncbi:MAG: MotA/TolQ/ExbB proton channel family protein [Rickettsiales bacterium]|nr:MotA/TolQ/ExbB proton channel family protein [Rickettsiales bacterium]
MIQQLLTTIKLGGFSVYPLFLLAIFSLAIICDKILFYKKLAKLPESLLDLIETYDFSWIKLEVELKKLSEKNCYRKFFSVIANNKTKPLWWLESRSADEAKLIEKQFAGGLWILETIVTAAPLLGLLGTIMGMMDAFKLIGSEGLVNPHGPNGVTAGVAQALIATAIGIFIAIYSLFAFNYFSRKQDQAIDELERLGTRVLDHIKLDHSEKN